MACGERGTVPRGGRRQGPLAGPVVVRRFSERCLLALREHGLDLLPQPNQGCRQDGLWIRGQELHHQLVGLLASHVIAVHVLPHVRPVLFEALGSGLRVSVASLPIIEFLFNWNGIGSLSVEAVALKDAQAFVFCAVVLVSVFAVLSAIADLSRPRALFAR